MSELVFVAIIGFMGAILGALISAFGTIAAPELKARSEGAGRQATNIPCGLVGLIISTATAIGLGSGLIVGTWLLDVTPRPTTEVEESPPTATSIFPTNTPAPSVHTPTLVPPTNTSVTELIDTPTSIPEPTSTGTPTPIPILTPIPTSELSILFQDDFSNPNRGWNQYLTTSQERMSYRDGMLQISTSPGDMFERNIAYPGLRFENFVLEVDIQSLTDVPSARMGVVFRAYYDYEYTGYESGDRSRYYRFDIGSDGMYELQLRDKKVESLIPPSFSEAIHRFGETNHVQIEAVRGHFRFFINDQLIAEFEDSGYANAHDHDFSKGDIGLIVDDPNDVGVKIGFDNLVVGLFQDQ
jgi:hypothetical protein